MNEKVGAGILNVITESLYDNPTVVFREYVQNSVDSFQRNHSEKQEIKIWNKNNNLLFLDNGNGIDENNFFDEMKNIGTSKKIKQRDLGYKGIGRLSGVPYCQEVVFCNIIDYNKKKVQTFSINGCEYEKIKNSPEYSQMSFSCLMDRISRMQSEKSNFDEFEEYIQDEDYKKMLKRTNTGFLVVLKSITSVMKKAIENEEHIIEELQWLLPVEFDSDLYNSKYKELFDDLLYKDEKNNMIFPIATISYNDSKIFRPIKNTMLREYVCKNNFKYAIGFHSFNSSKIAIDSNNKFSGIRIYMDNMLLCNENELLRNLANYGLLDHTINGQLQSIRGIGAMIYITDKVNISANARRTFIEVTDNDSIEFLKFLAEFVNIVYETRYALSNYFSAKMKQNYDTERLRNLKTKAIEQLTLLAKEEITLSEYEDDFDMDRITPTEFKRAIKKCIALKIDQEIKEFINEVDFKKISKTTVYDEFINWLKNKNQ